MFLMPKETGKFLRRYAPAIWVENPIFIISISIALGLVAAIWQVLFPEDFREFAPTVREVAGRC